MKCVNHNVLQHCNIHHIGKLIENVNGRLLCVFVWLWCFLSVLQVSFATNDYNRSTFSNQKQKKNTYRAKERHFGTHTCSHTKKMHWFFLDQWLQRRFHLSHNIPIHKSSVGSINKAFNKCKLFFFWSCMFLCWISLNRHTMTER